MKMDMDGVFVLPCPNILILQLWNGEKAANTLTGAPGTGLCLKISLEKLHKNKLNLKMSMLDTHMYSKE